MTTASKLSVKVADPARDFTPTINHHPVVESIGNKPVAIHTVRLKPYGEPGNFNELRSWNGFRRSMQDHIIIKRKSIDGKPNVGIRAHRLTDQRFRIYFPDDFALEYELYHQISERSGKPHIFDALPVYRHESVHDFYEFIGYEKEKRSLKSWAKKPVKDSDG